MFKKKKRDEFPARVRNNLARRCSFICSNPNCLKSTIGPQSNNDKSINIGVAAHITAAALEGPRYRKNLTVKERTSINNAIWLCHNCSRLIDADPIFYTEILLKEWKKNAETRAREEIINGKRDSSKNLISFELIRLVPSKFWREERERYNDALFQPYEYIFKKYRFDFQNPVLDLVVKNNSESNILAQSIGVQFNYATWIDIGYGPPDSFPIRTLVDSKIDLPSSISESHKIHSENFKDPIAIKSDGFFRLKLELSLPDRLGYNIANISLCIRTNSGLFISDGILIDLIEDEEADEDDGIFLYSFKRLINLIIYSFYKYRKR